MPTNVLIVGAGKIGATIATMLASTGDYTVTVTDKSAAQLARLTAHPRVRTRAMDASSVDEMTSVFAGNQIVVSAGPYMVNPAIAEAALRAGASYFDLTEDRETTAAIRRVAEHAADGQIFMPQCGLAPGFIGILAAHLATGFDALHDIKMRVGALPQYPSNMLMYNLTWSTDGLINEYCNPCEAIHDGKLVEVLPLEGLEMFSLDGVNYEAFNTSGGLGTLCETLDGKVRNLDYKTVRYQGHRYLMQFLTQDLRLAHKRDMLKQILEESVPITYQDVVLTFCTISGMKNGQLFQMSDARKIYGHTLYGEHLSAIQITTAGSLCALLDLHRAGKLPKRGFVRQEQVPFAPYIENRFGAHYASRVESVDTTSARIVPAQ